MNSQLTLPTVLAQMVVECGSINQLSQNTGVKQEYLKELLKGHRTNPSPKTLRQLQLTEHRTYTRNNNV